MMTILVTGATGTVGSKLVRELEKRDEVVVRAGVRATFDFEKPETMAAALVGVDKVFLLAPQLRDQVGASARLVELAKAAGVKHIVKLSALGCDEEPTIAFGRAHRDVERLLASSGMEWTALRPNNFMDNFLGQRHGAFAPDARGDIALPWGNAACSFIAARDIAAVAAVVLTTTGHHEKKYDLTGPEALRIAQAAELLSSSARIVRYVDVPEETARRKMLEAHMPPSVVESVLELHALGKAGRAAIVTNTVETLTGKPATTFATFVRENAS